MARVLESYTFVGHGRPNLYDWESLLDGQIHELKAGDDFQCKPQTLRYLAKRAAKLAGKGVHTAKPDENTIVIQAYELPAEVTSE